MLNPHEDNSESASLLWINFTKKLFRLSAALWWNDLPDSFFSARRCNEVCVAHWNSSSQYKPPSFYPRFDGLPLLTNHSTKSSMLDN